MSENSSKLDRKLTAEILVQFVFWSHSEVPDTELKKKNCTKTKPTTVCWIELPWKKKKKHFAGEPLKGSTDHISISAQQAES